MSYIDFFEANVETQHDICVFNVQANVATQHNILFTRSYLQTVLTVLLHRIRPPKPSPPLSAPSADRALVVLWGESCASDYDLSGGVSGAEESIRTHSVTQPTVRPL